MNKKSNEELENIIQEKSNYTEEAIQAVIWELEDRNLIKKDEIELEETIQNQEQGVQILENNESVFEEIDLPVLYSKKAILWFTILFSPIFGAVLLMSNFKSVNKPKERMQVLFFGIGYTILSAVLLNYLPKTFFLTLMFNFIGYAILSESFWNKSLGKELQHTHKQISKPLIISLMIVAFMVFLQFLPLILEG